MAFKKRFRRKGELLSLLTKKVAKEITPVSLRKPAKNQKFEAPPKLDGC